MRLAAAALTAAALVPLPARAIPAFARRTGFQCTACHNAWPELNAVGRLFKDNGYRMPGVDNAPTAQPPAYWPMAARAFAGYQWSRTQGQGAGGIAPPSADLIIAGTVAPNVSFELLPTGFGPDGAATLEAAWASLHAWAGGVSLAAKLGRQELDLPASEHRTLTTGTPYLAYHFHPPGSTVGFELGDNQSAAQVLAVSRDDRYRFSAALVNGGGAGTAHWWSTPLVFGHATAAFPLDAKLLHRVRVGALGWQGWWPSRVPLDAAGAPVEMAGHALERFGAFGADATLRFLDEAQPLTVRAAWLRGTEDAALTPGAVRGPGWQGGYVEAIVLPRLDLALTARLEGVFATAQAVDGRPPGRGDATGVALSARYYLYFSPRASAAIHTELSGTRTVAGADDGADLHVETLLFGVDFAI